MPLLKSFIPTKKKGVDILLNKTGDVIVRLDGETHKISGLSQLEFTTIWNTIDGKKDVDAICLMVMESLQLTKDFVQGTLEGLTGIVLEPSGDKQTSQAVTDAPDTGEQKLHAEKLSHTFYNQHIRISSDKKGESEYKKIVIVGGGTAGYFAALAFQKLRPDLEITLVESSKIPVIGVGEATTPVILSFLHEILEISPLEFYSEVKPSWKLGIKFDWGAPGDNSFINPFGINNLLESHYYNGSLDHVTLGTSLMMDGKGLIAKNADGSLYSLMNQVGYAYHLENRSLIAYLQKRIKASNITWLDRTIEDVTLAENGDVASILTDRSETLTADLFVDCTGFRSVLLGGAVKSEYISFDKTLFTDRAVTGRFAESENPDPFTLAQSMKHGWNWSIPVNGETHRGYVFCSDHCSDDEAIEEMHSVNPEIEAFKIVRFKSGRHKEFWKNNVVGIGNAYGFVEPLESTGLHMIIESVKTLIHNLPLSKNNTSIKGVINKKIGNQWDYIKWFLGIHFKYNHKIESPFWARCQNECDVSGVQDLIDLYTELGPLTAIEENDPEILLPLVHDKIFGTHGFDYMLIGQHVPYGNQFAINPDKSKYPAKRQKWQEITAQALSNRESLELMYNHPELIKQIV